ncbi:zinc uptake protein ZrgA [Planktotalea sp.]|uniref:zinc uptake protein ZrgA n=1 Tax=Planktotalea sp. TaxID=2029877 RepID=UPI003F6A7BE9
MKPALTCIALLTALPAFAEETRQLDAHEHGVGTLNIAIDGADVMMEFHAPGADIVGFEYAASSDSNLAAIESAIAMLEKPLDLFVLSPGAECVVASATAELEGDDDHGEEEHAGHDHDHDHDHDADKDEEHDHKDDHAHDEDGHADEVGHTEFHAEYTLTCNAPDALNEITFAYFETFTNAKEVEVQLISSTGAQAFEVPRASPVLNLSQ